MNYKKEKKVKVLIIAEAANPEWVSVPLVGWSHAKALHDITDSLIVTQIRNEEAFINRGLVSGKDFIAINSETIAKPIFIIGNLLSGKGKGWTTKMAFSYLSYPFFERLIWKTLGTRIKNGEFDIVHRITPLSPTLPSILAKKCDKYNVPFILGPLNGGLPWPKEFDKERRREREWLSYIRNIYKLLPGYHSTRRHARAMIIGSKATWNQIEEKYHSKCIYMPENGIDLSKFSKRREKRVSLPLKAIFIGRLVPYKGVDMLLRAFQDVLQNDKVKLEIVGDGPEESNLIELAKELNIAEKIIFQGWVDHSNIQNYLVESDILVFPSIREFGGGVVLEAMALGVMPLIVNYGGPSELITSECGITVALNEKSKIIEELKQKIEEIIKSPSIIDSKGDEARKIVQEKFTWEKKAEKTLSIYSRILKANNLKK